MRIPKIGIVLKIPTFFIFTLCIVIINSNKYVFIKNSNLIFFLKNIYRVNFINKVFLYFLYKWLILNCQKELSKLVFEKT